MVSEIVYDIIMFIFNKFTIIFFFSLVCTVSTWIRNSNTVAEMKTRRFIVKPAPDCPILVGSLRNIVFVTVFININIKYFNFARFSSHSRDQKYVYNGEIIK